MPSTNPRKPRKPPRNTAVRTGRLRAADPFELIRWLARSQPDPRKALAELVQNSLDAGARTIRITRRRHAGRTELRIFDDGAGVIPELDREEALAYLATHIGHSRKRELTPEQRRELMLQGKYGIGLLGFWSIGGELEIRSQIPGQTAMLLRLHEDSPSYEIEKIRGRLPIDEERWTEVVVRDLHRPALGSLSARRAADFLGTELRGQLLAHAARVLIYDGISRGRAAKVVEVQPRRFDGERLPLPETIATRSFSPITVELYLLPPGGEAGRVAVSQAGTIVYEDIAELAAGDFARPPWSDVRLAGILDFADFQVPPGTRRAVVLDQAAAEFLEAVRSLEPLINAQLELEQDRARAELEAGLMRQLERAFRDVPRRAPIYDFFEVLERGRARFAPGAEGEGGASSDEQGQSEDAAGVALPEPGAPGDDESPSDTRELPLLAGPLAAAQITPAQTKVERLGQRRFRVRATDAAGLRITRPLQVTWETNAAEARIEPDGATSAVFHAGPAAGAATVSAHVSETDVQVTAHATIEVVEELAGADSMRSGIPEPVFVDDPAGTWRSRYADKRWEVNSAHPDYREAAETPRRKLRYLAALLAKEVVLHSFPAPSLAPALESMVEVLTITERRLERG